LLGTIARSSAYRLSARFEGEWKDAYTNYFARKYVRMLGAEELHDAIALATSRPGSFRFGPENMGMAMQVSGPSAAGDLRTFMNTFGQSNRNNPPRPLTGSPLQPLILMHTPVVNDRIKAEKDSRVERLLASYADDGRVVEELFLATLSRPPSSAELSIGVEAMANNRAGGAQNLQWALINKVEFLFNY
jgi:hypothetical protein